MAEVESEVLCGSLGEFCLQVIDSLDMAIVPSVTAAELDAKLANVVREILSQGIWRYSPGERPQYLIGEKFSDDCYKKDGHRHIYRAGDQLAKTLRAP